MIGLVLLMLGIMGVCVGACKDILKLQNEQDH